MGRLCARNVACSGGGLDRQACCHGGPGCAAGHFQHRADALLGSLAAQGDLALAQRLFTADANVRNVKAFFSVKRSKFEPAIGLSGMQGG